MKIETIKVDALVPYARNSRTHSEEQVVQIVASIREFGFTNPVLIDGDGGIIAGHGRVLAARKMGLATVPCLRLAHLSEAQKRAYIIADNKLALNAGWDDEMLALEISDLKALDYDLTLTGFDGDEIAELLREVDTVDMPTMPMGEKSPYQQITFTLTIHKQKKCKRQSKLRSPLALLLQPKTKTATATRWPVFAKHT